MNIYEIVPYTKTYFSRRDIFNLGKFYSTGLASVVPFSWDF